MRSRIESRSMQFQLQCPDCKQSGEVRLKLPGDWAIGLFPDCHFCGGLIVVNEVPSAEWVGADVCLSNDCGVCGPSAAS